MPSQFTATPYYGSLQQHNASDTKSADASFVSDDGKITKKQENNPLITFPSTPQGLLALLLVCGGTIGLLGYAFNKPPDKSVPGINSY